MGVEVEVGMVRAHLESLYAKIAFRIRAPEIKAKTKPFYHQHGNYTLCSLCLVTKLESSAP